MLSRIVKGVKALAGKAVRFIPLPNNFSLFGQNPFTFNFERTAAIEKGYGQNPYVFMVVNRIVERAINIPFRVIDEEGQEVETLPAEFASVINRPNSEGWINTLERLFANYLAGGEVFIFEDRALGFQNMTGILVPNTQDVIINVDGFGNILSYDFSYLGKYYTSIPPDRLLQIKRANILNQLHNGLSNLVPGAVTYQADNEVWQTEASLHKNKGVSGVLFYRGARKLAPKEEKALQAKYEVDHTGVKNFGKIKVSAQELGYIPMGLNGTDLASIDTARLTHLRAICQLYNVDSKLFGDPNASTYNNIPAAKLGMLTDAVLPLLKKIMPELFVWISEKTGLDQVLSYESNLETVPEMQTARDQLSSRLGREVIQGILSPTLAFRMLYPHLADETVDAAPGNAPVAELLQIIERVQNDTLTRDQALSLMVQLYGLTIEAAEDILG